MKSSMHRSAPRLLLVCALTMAAGAAARAQESLADAVLYGSAARVDAMIAGGADVNAVDSMGLTPLMTAAAQGHTAIARKLIAAGATVSTIAEDGTTALMRAASANRGEMA